MFFLFNVGLMLLPAIGYCSFLPTLHSGPGVTFISVIVAWVFSLLATIGQLSLLSCFACLIALLIISFIPQKWLAFLLAVVFGASLVLFVVADVAVYHLYHFHFGGVFWDILRSGALSEVLVFSTSEWVLAACLLLFVVLVEVLLVRYTWSRVLRNNKQNSMKMFALLFGIFWFAFAIYGYSLSLTTNSNNNAALRSNAHLIIMSAKIVPYYSNTLAVLANGRVSSANIDSADDGYFAQNSGVTHRLHYPLHPLQIQHKKQPYNIVVITIDTWRHNAMTAKVTPNIAQFAQQSIQFDHHISGGNCTQPGIFTMFYGLPATYWSATLAQHTGPAFINALLHQHYQLGIYASASLHYPAFNDNVFSHVPNLEVETKGATSAVRDQAITGEFKQFITQRNKKHPFFSFLFYDEVHNWCGSDQPYQKPFQPAIQSCDRMALSGNTSPIPYLNRYDNAAHYVDGLVGHVLNTLKSQHLLKHTIVIITADHGEEFNDENLGYWGHASAFDRYQIHVPMIVHWPGMKPTTITYPTSHFDIVPTLMQRVLGVKNPIADYSVGQSLFKKGGRPFYVVGSYTNYAVLQPQRINVFYTEGSVDVQNRDAQEIAGATMNPKVFAASLQQLNQYYSLQAN